jgi:hypothetical protein
MDPVAKQANSVQNLNFKLYLVGWAAAWVFFWSIENGLSFSIYTWVFEVSVLFREGKDRVCVWNDIYNIECSQNRMHIIGFLPVRNIWEYPFHGN